MVRKAKGSKTAPAAAEKKEADVIPIGRAKKAAADKPPEAGENMLPMLTDNQRRGLFVIELSKLERLEQIAKKAISDSRNQRKVMITHGFEKGHIDFALYVKKASDTDVRKLMETQAEVLRFLGNPLAVQADFFDADRTPAVDRAFEEGKTAGMEGKRRESPHDASTPQGQRWLDGWSEGQGIVAAGFKPIQAKGMPSAGKKSTVVDDDKKDVRPRFNQAPDVSTDTVQ